MSVAEQQKIALIQSMWHHDIVDQARLGFTAEIVKLGHDESRLDFFQVAGAFELPLHVARLARTGRYEAIVAAGLIVNGGIYRHEFVSSAVIDGLMRAQLDLNVPVFSVVLTPHNFHDSVEHEQFFHDHFVKKGAEAARACTATLESLRNIES
ncbi:6,7-dimethyl-8-ribityllumazine synthase [Frankia tisae]|uniref:6,7-dimethyl-8-ribityllumazine synthase n=1 Tax=Frankia tisae TaxID=2950104 RepID=UPI0021BFF432|nr:6,7-dimethyl-8-ribityllumazine synthase [Frankia tisae]